MPDYAKLREQMVAGQIAARGITDPRVLIAMREVRRHEFVDARQASRAYADSPMSIGLGQTISQPYIVAWMTELLRIGRADQVLEIGTGCGYQTAVLGCLAAHVYSVELQPDLSRQAALNLSRAGITNVSLRVGDGFEGWQEHAPYPCIIATAAPLEIPDELTRQLASGGRLVLPVGSHGNQQMLRITKGKDGALAQEALGRVAFVPMLRAQG